MFKIKSHKSDRKNNILFLFPSQLRKPFHIFKSAVDFILFFLLLWELPL
jgi:hypothetical protein